MFRRPLRRAVALSLGALLAFAGTAAADSVFADADILTPEVQGSRHLGDVAAGATVEADVQFRVVCAGLQHVDPAQSVVLAGGGGTIPSDGAIVSVSTATLAPLAMAWGPDGEGCPDPVPAYDGGATSHVVLRAPTAPGTYLFTVMWARSLSPAGVNDANAFTRTPTSVNFTLRVGDRRRGHTRSDADLFTRCGIGPAARDDHRVLLGHRHGRCLGQRQLRRDGGGHHGPEHHRRTG
jgi:hypothetical protein